MISQGLPRHISEMGGVPNATLYGDAEESRSGHTYQFPQNRTMDTFVEPKQLLAFFLCSKASF